METANARLTLASVVVAVPELRFGAVLSELVRKLWPAHPAPLITEVPGQVLTVIYPDKQLQCQFANNRVEVTDSRGLAAGADPFPLIAVNAFQALYTSSGDKTVAHGFNFELHVPVVGHTPPSFVHGRFFLNPQQNIADAFQAQLSELGFIAIMDRQGCRIQLLVEPSKLQASLRVHANFHFEGASPPLKEDEFRDTFEREYESFKDALSRL
jgi:hypothetical protein